MKKKYIIALLSLVMMPMLLRAETPEGISYGMYVGTGLNCTTSSIRSAFSNSWAFSAGVVGGYYGLKLKADITYAQPKVNNLNIMSVVNQEAVDTYASYYAITVAPGYTVYSSRQLSVTPSVGVSWSNYSWNVQNYKYSTTEFDELGNPKREVVNYESPSLRNFNWYASVDIDWHFHRTLSGFGSGERIVSSLRLSPYIMRGVYDKANPSLRGYQVGFTIAYFGLATTLGL